MAHGGTYKVCNKKGLWALVLLGKGLTNSSILLYTQEVTGSSPVSPISSSVEAGNLTNANNGQYVYEFDYDYENRIVKNTRDSSDIAKFAYDALGRRIRAELMMDVLLKQSEVNGGKIPEPGSEEWNKSKEIAKQVLEEFSDEK